MSKIKQIKINLDHSISTNEYIKSYIAVIDYHLSEATKELERLKAFIDMNLRLEKENKVLATGGVVPRKLWSNTEEISSIVRQEESE